METVVWLTGKKGLGSCRKSTELSDNGQGLEYEKAGRLEGLTLLEKE